MDRSTSDRTHASSSDGHDRGPGAGTAGRTTLTSELEDESVEWEAVSAGEYDVGAQLAHLGKAGPGGGDAETASSEKAPAEDVEREESEEGEGEVDASFTPDTDSGGDASGGDDGDDDGDDDDDDSDDGDEAGAGRMTARATSFSAAGAAAAPPATAAAAPSASDKWRDKIAARDEQRTVTRQPKRRNAPANAFNNKKVKANHLSKSKQKRKHQIDRAGVRFREQDKFSPIAARVPRYRIIDGNVATSAGVLDAIRSTTIRLAINPAHSRNLVLEDGTALGPCVLTWHGQRRAAWIQISKIKLATTRTNKPAALKSQQAAIKRAVDRRADQWKSKVASPQALREAAHFKFGGSGAAPTTFDKNRYIVPNQRSAKANKVADYLLKDDGKSLNVMINLPRDRQAPIAVDLVVKDEDHFFVPHTGGVVQEVSIYKRGKNETKVRARQTWVFGHVGMKGDTEPDPKRRGWVPLRVLDPVR